MPKTTPLPDWTGEDVFVIGGGSSLRTFQFRQLAPLNNIGCNQAFLLGPEICHIATFGDFRFWQRYASQLGTFDGWVATNHLLAKAPDWMRFFKRQDEGLASVASGMLAWNNNTGAMSINLALALGAERVFLLGYDLAPGATPDVSHWHNEQLENPKTLTYDKFACGFRNVRNALPRVFPGKQIINVSDGASKLDLFPIYTFAEAGLIAPA